MPTISLVDGFGLVLEVQPGPGSLWQQFKDLPAMLTDRRLDLDQLDAETGISFKQPSSFTLGAVALSTLAGVTAHLSTIVRTAKRTSLFPDSGVGEDMPLTDQDRWIALKIDATAGASASAQISNASFGLSVGGSAEIANYVRLDLSDDLPRALDKLIGSFSIPHQFSDLAALTEDRVASFTCDGSLKVSSSATFSVVANPLASISLPVLSRVIDVKSGASVTVGASIAFSGGYEIRLRKIAGGLVKMGIFRQRSATWRISVDADVDVDLLSKITGVLNGKAPHEVTVLTGGVDDAVKGVLQKTLKLGLDRSLASSLSSGLSGLAEHQAAFLFQIDPAQFDDLGKEAVTSALRGDLSALTTGSVPKGVTLLKDATSVLQQREHTFKLNLLGIYNFVSVSTLIAQGKMLVDDTTGEVTITDNVTANNVKAEMLNVAGKPNLTNGAALRKALASSLLITAAYRGSKAVAASPSLTSQHVFFELHDPTDTPTLRKELSTAVALGLMSEEDQETLSGHAPCGKTTASATTGYGDAACYSLFLNQGAVRSENDYEHVGRRASQALLRPEDLGHNRERALIDDNLWASMKDKGQPGFHLLFANANASELADIAADYTVITWWACAMSAMSVKLYDFGRFIASHATLGTDDPLFQKQRHDLTEHLKQVASQTREEFGRPWGLVAMDLASGRQATAQVNFSGPGIAISKQRTGVLTVGVR